MGLVYHRARPEGDCGGSACMALFLERCKGSQQAKGLVSPCRSFGDILSGCDRPSLSTFANSLVLGEHEVKGKWRAFQESRVGSTTPCVKRLRPLKTKSSMVRSFHGFGQVWWRGTDLRGLGLPFRRAGGQRCWGYFLGCPAVEKGIRCTGELNGIAVRRDREGLLAPATLNLPLKRREDNLPSKALRNPPRDLLWMTKSTFC